MLLEDFMRKNPNNWKELLKEKPYCIDIKEDGDYQLLKYRQFESDFNLPLVREARGAIFYQGTCVCYPFNKFGNWQEGYAETNNIDWNSAKILEKIDGSLIKFWYHNNEWHISTNGTIDAAKAICQNSDYNFKMLVDKAIAKIPDFWKSLNINYCYMFELVSPYNTIVIPYNETALYFLGKRNMNSRKEENGFPAIEGMRFPAIYNFNSFSQTIEIAKTLAEDKEGFVVVDKDFRRIKIKGDEYLKRHYARMNGTLTAKKIFEMWKDDSLDDYLAFFPASKLSVAKIVAFYQQLARKMDNYWNGISFSNKKELLLE